MALENQWLQAAKTQSPDLIAASYDDRIVDTDSSGKVATKAQGMAYLKATKFTTAEYEDVQVTVFGNTAIAAGGFKAKGTDSKGPFDIHERWTDTWETLQSRDETAIQASPIGWQLEKRCS